MPLIDLADDPALYAEINAHAKEKDGSEFLIREDEDWMVLIDIWKAAKTKSEYYKAHEALARSELIKGAGSKNCKGYGVKLQKITRKGNIRYDQIEALQGVDLEQYRDMPSQSWRITIDE